MTDIIKEKNKYAFLKYLAVFAMIFFSDGAFANYTIEGYYIKIFGSILLGIIGVYLIITKIRKINVLFIGVLILMLVSVYINSSPWGISIGFICVCIFAYAFTLRNDIDDFLDVFLNLMRFLAIVSLIVYFANLLFPQLMHVLPTTTYSYNLGGGVSYYELLITHVPVNATAATRNYGVFWEPGTYSIFANIALLISLFKNKGSKLIFDVVIFSVVIITTFSTTGYIAALLVFACFLFNNKASINRRLFILLLIIIALAIMLVEFGGAIYDYVFYKFSLGEDNSSYISRVYSMYGNLLVTAENPLIGVGYSNSDEAMVEKLIRFTTEELHQTNTMLNYFATFGVFVGIFFTHMLWKLAKVMSGQSTSTFLIFVTLFIMTSGENLIASIFFTILIFFGVGTLRTRYLSAFENTPEDEQI